jgi:hypothetical protein
MDSIRFDMSFLKKEESNHKFNLKSIRRVGKKDGVKSLNILSEKKKTISLTDLRATQQDISQQVSKPKKLKKIKKAIESLKLSKTTIKDFLKVPSTDFISATKILNSLEDTDVVIDMEIPEGIAEDELNKHELVFYGFQKRTATAYINSFQKELNNFERTNPHLRFPLTASKQKISSRITYDKNGDILKIETVKWTDVKKLQSFFMDVLQNMTSIPNPPQQILKDDQFVINYVFTVNN